MAPSDLLRTARQRAGLSQRALAKRARTTQSVVARIESGTVSPTWDTLTRLLKASGFVLDATLAAAPVKKSHMLKEVARILSLTPEQRLEEVSNMSRFLAAAQRVEKGKA